MGFKIPLEHLMEAGEEYIPQNVVVTTFKVRTPICPLWIMLLVCLCFPKLVALVKRLIKYQYQSWNLNTTVDLFKAVFPAVASVQWLKWVKSKWKQRNILVLSLNITETYIKMWVVFFFFYEPTSRLYLVL